MDAPLDDYTSNGTHAAKHESDEFTGQFDRVRRLQGGLLALSMKVRLQTVRADVVGCSDRAGPGVASAPGNGQATDAATTCGWVQAGRFG